MAMALPWGVLPLGFLPLGFLAASSALQKLTAKDEASENWYHRAPKHVEKREYYTSAAKSAARA